MVIVGQICLFLTSMMPPVKTKGPDDDDVVVASSSLYSKSEVEKEEMIGSLV